MEKQAVQEEEALRSQIVISELGHAVRPSVVVDDDSEDDDGHIELTDDEWQEMTAGWIHHRR